MGGVRVRHWLPPLLYMVVIFLLSSQARVPVPEGLPDAALHAPEFFVLGCLLCRAFLATGGPRPRALALALTISIAYGLLDELHQSFVPGRVASLGDFAADAAGAIFAVTLFALLPAAQRTAGGSGVR